MIIKSETFSQTLGAIKEALPSPPQISDLVGTGGAEPGGIVGPMHPIQGMMPSGFAARTLGTMKSTLTGTTAGLPTWALLLTSLAAVVAASYFFIFKKKHRRVRRRR